MFKKFEEKCIGGRIVCRLEEGKHKIRSRRGMELVQVAIMVGIAVAAGLIFKTQITEFVRKTFSSLMESNFVG